MWTTRLGAIVLHGLVAATAACALQAAPQADAAQATTSETSTRLLVALDEGAAVEALQPLIAVQALQLERSLPQIGVYALGVPQLRLAAVIAALERHPAVERVQPDSVLSAFELRPDDPHWSGQWGLELAGFPRAWEVTRGAAETRVAVLDTGVDRSHPDFNRVLRGYNAVKDTTEAADDNGHGTAVAGIIAAVGDNARGLAGVCWECAVLPVKVLAADGSGYSADVAAGVVWAVDHGARVINLSLGARTNTVALSRAVAYAARNDVVIVAAAGNTGATTRSYPAAADHVIAVAASDPADRLYGWSNRGDWVDVAAPGCNMTLRRGGGYAGLCGTSSAAPLLAGLAALIRSARPTLSAVETNRILRNAVTPIGPLVQAGRVDAARAFSAPRPPRAEPAREAMGAGVQLRRFARHARLGRRESIRRFSREHIPARKTLRPGLRRISLPAARPAVPPESKAGPAGSE